MFILATSVERKATKRGLQCSSEPAYANADLIKEYRQDLNHGHANKDLSINSDRPEKVGHNKQGRGDEIYTVVPGSMYLYSLHDRYESGHWHK